MLHSTDEADRIDRFVRRLCTALVTPSICAGTFKVKKTVFQDEAYDLARVTDPVFYLNQQKQTYERLTPEAHDLIIKGKQRF